MAIWKKYTDKFKSQIVIEKGIHTFVIKRYGLYYIWYIEGWKDEYPCIIQLTDEQFADILKDNSIIHDIIINSEYKGEYYHVDHGIHEYLKYEEHLNEIEIEKYIELFNKDRYIKWEFFNSIMYDCYPFEWGIKINGLTAEQIHDMNNLSYLDTYLYILNNKLKG